jgi:hypothetical protein
LYPADFIGSSSQTDGNSENIHHHHRRTSMAGSFSGADSSLINDSQYVKDQLMQELMGSFGEWA